MALTLKHETRTRAEKEAHTAAPTGDANKLESTFSTNELASVGDACFGDVQLLGAQGSFPGMYGGTLYGVMYGGMLFQCTLLIPYEVYARVRTHHA
eukprot:scaffold264036_cov20-Prasinocladus_malaysianus.AAC.1